MGARGNLVLELPGRGIKMNLRFVVSQPKWESEQESFSDTTPRTAAYLQVNYVRLQHIARALDHRFLLYQELVVVYQRTARSWAQVGRRRGAMVVIVSREELDVPSFVQVGWVQAHD